MKGLAMHTLTYTTFRNHLAQALDDVHNNQDPVMITRQNGQKSVLMSLQDFHAWQETAYLMVNPYNAQRLVQSIHHAEEGRTSEHALLDT